MRNQWEMHIQLFMLTQNPGNGDAAVQSPGKIHMQIELRPGQPGRPHVFIALKKLINFPAGNVAVHPVNPEGELPVKSTLIASVESGKSCLTAPLRLQARSPIGEQVVERDRKS